MRISRSRKRRDSVERESFRPENVADSLRSRFALARGMKRIRAGIALIGNHRVRADFARGVERFSLKPEQDWASGVSKWWDF
jgi:hypothetical protein